MTRPRTVDGDRYDFTVTIGGQQVSTGGPLPAGITAEKAVELMVDGMTMLAASAREEVHRQQLELERRAGDEDE